MGVRCEPRVRIAGLLGRLWGMGFFDRNRKELIEKGYDPARLPPGQYLTDRFPVLHVGDVPDVRRRASGT